MGIVGRLLCSLGAHNAEEIGEAVSGSRLFLCKCRRCGKEWIKVK